MVTKIEPAIIMPFFIYTFTTLLFFHLAYLKLNLVLCSLICLYKYILSVLGGNSVWLDSTSTVISIVALTASSTVDVAVIVTFPSFLAIISSIVFIFTAGVVGLFAFLINKKRKEAKK